MIKPIILILLLYFSCSPGFSQIRSIRKENYALQNFSSRTISIGSAVKPYLILRNIQNICIEDRRSDTLAVGLEQKNHQKPHFLVFSHGLTNEVSQFVNEYVQLGHSDSFAVIMVLKKFWLTGAVDSGENQKPWNISTDSVETASTLMTTIDLILKKGTAYYLLYRFDSSFSKLQSMAWGQNPDVLELGVNRIITGSMANSKVSKSAGELTKEALAAALAGLVRADTTVKDIMLRKRRFTRKELDDYYTRPYRIPILQDSILHRGVYLSFNDFKNNDPAIADFKIENDKLTDQLYVRQADGQWTIRNDDWGYCDGKNLFIRSVTNYFLLQRRGNAFYIYGSRRLTRTPNLQFGNTLHASRKFYVELRPYQLDWDNGELY
jgi:hypothetical protein